MTKMRRFLERRFRVGEDPPEKWLTMFGIPVSSGQHVTEQTALRFAAVFSCVRVLSESVAQIPLKVFERLSAGGKREAPEHPLYPLVHDWPNEEVTSFSWREASMGHLLTWGNGYSFIEHGGDGRVKALHLMKPDRTIPQRLESGILVYDYIDDRGRTHRYLRDQILHVPALGYDGVVGYSPIRMAAETIGTGIAAAQFAGRFFANGAVPGGVLEHPEKLSQEGHDRLRTDWERLHTGGENAHRVAILEEGMKYQRITINPVDAQLLESLRFSRQEIAGIYRVPAHFINDLEHATFSNIEQLGLEFVQFSLAPWLARLENSMNRRLFLSSERGRYFVEFVVDGLLRGDVQSRNNANRTAIMGGWKSPNEVRAQENLPPFEGGDNYFMQGAMMTVENIIDQQAPNTGGGVGNGSEGKAGPGGNGAPRDPG